MVAPGDPVPEVDVAAGVGVPEGFGHEIGPETDEGDVAAVRADAGFQAIVVGVVLRGGVARHVGLAGRVGDQGGGAGDAVAQEEVVKAVVVDLPGDQVGRGALEDHVAAVGAHRRGEAGAEAVRDRIGLRDQLDRPGGGRRARSQEKSQNGAPVQGIHGSVFTPTSQKLNSDRMKESYPTVPLRRIPASSTATRTVPLPVTKGSRAMVPVPLVDRGG